MIEHSFLGRLHPRTCHVEFQWIWPWEIDEDSYCMLLISIPLTCS
jgi:hypothetical protein